MLIFVRESCCVLIYHFVKHVHWFSPQEYIFIHKVCRCADFVRGACSMLIFCSGNLLHLDLYVRDACTLIFLLVQLILFMELVTCWFFVHETFCMLIFLFVQLIATRTSSANKQTAHDKFYEQNKFHEGKNQSTSLKKKKIKMQKVSRTKISIQQVPRAKNQPVTSFMNRISYTRKKTILHVLRREKSRCNNFHKQKSACNKFHDK